MTDPVSFLDEIFAKIDRLEREAALHHELVDALAKLDDVMRDERVAIGIERVNDRACGVRAKIFDGTRIGFGSTLAEALIRLANPERNAT